MNLQEKELIEQARMMGIPAHEFAAQFITRDLVEATLTGVRKVIKLNESQEAKLIDQLNSDVTDLVSAAVVVIAAQGVSAIGCVVKSVMVTGKNLRVVADVDASDPQRHALTDTVTQRALLVLAEDEYHAALDSNKPQKDQKDLPLDEQHPVDKILEQGGEQAEQSSGAGQNPADLSPYELAFMHVTGGGEISPKAIQNAAGVKRKDVADLILKLQDSGVLSEPDQETGLRTLVPLDQRPMTGTEIKIGSGVQGAAGGYADGDALRQPEEKNQNSFDEDLYADAVLLVQREKKISLSFLKSQFQVDEETAEAMIARMEQDGVVSEENDMGGRAVYD